MSNQEKYGPEKDQEKYGPEKDQPEPPTPHPQGSENSGGPRRGVEGQPEAPPVEIKCSSGDEVNPAPPAKPSWTPTPGPSREPNTPEKPYISKPTAWHFRPMDETRARSYDKICQEAEMKQAFSTPNQGFSIREGGGESLRRDTIHVTKIGKLRKTNDPTKIKGWKRKAAMSEFPPSKRPNTANLPFAWVPKTWADTSAPWAPPTQTTANLPFAWVPKTWADTSALSWAPPTQTTTPWALPSCPLPTTTSVPTAFRAPPTSTITTGALMTPPSSTITSGAVMTPPSSTITSGAVMTPPSSTITSGALMTPPSSTITSGAVMTPPSSTITSGAVMTPPSSPITSGAVMPPPSSTITSGAVMPPPSSTITSGALMTPSSSTITSGALMTPPSSTITSGALMNPPTFAPPTWTTTTEPSWRSPTKAVTSGFPTIKLGSQKKKSQSPQKTKPRMQVNPAPPAKPSWTPTPGPSREPNTPEKPYISKPTAWHFRPLDETRARSYDKICQEAEMKQAFSTPNQGFSIREGGGLRKTNDPTKIKGWKRKAAMGEFPPSSRPNTANPPQLQKTITESPQEKKPRMQLEEPAEDSRGTKSLSEGEDNTPLDELVDYMINEEVDETPVVWILPPPEERAAAVPEADRSRQEYIELRRSEEMIQRILMNALNNLQFDSMTFHGEMVEIRSSNELPTVDPASDKNWKYTDKVLVEASPNAVRINVAAENVRENVLIIGEDFMAQPWCGITLSLCDPIEGYNVAIQLTRKSETEASLIVKLALFLLEIIIDLINENHH